MHNRYAGDICDYVKIGLLNALQQVQGLYVGVNWCSAETLWAEKDVDGAFKQDD